MKNKIAFAFLVAVGTAALCLGGFIIGANYGGNYAEQYVALGVRGYEATGAIGGSLGIILGIVIAFFSYHRLFCEKGL